ncbi:MAG: MarR family transcriptional regulator [Actinomycetota bacterium]
MGEHSATVGRLAAVIAHLQTDLNRIDRLAAIVLDVGSAEDLQVLRMLELVGSLRVGELARRRGSSVATVSARIDRLEKRNLVTRRRHPDDRRAVIASLTPNGAELAAQSRRWREESIAAIAEGYPVEDLERLAGALGDDPVLRHHS